MKIPPKKPCPTCGQLAVVPVVYGYPSESTMGHAMQQDILLGGCVIDAYPPPFDQVGCVTCGWRGKRVDLARSTRPLQVPDGTEATETTDIDARGARKGVRRARKKT